MNFLDLVLWLSIGFSVLAVVWGHKHYAQAVHGGLADVQAAEQNTERNLREVLVAPSKVEALSITSLQGRSVTLDAVLLDGRLSCLANRIEDVPGVLAKLEIAGFDISKVEQY